MFIPLFLKLYDRGDKKRKLPAIWAGRLSSAVLMFEPFIFGNPRPADDSGVISKCRNRNIGRFRRTRERGDFEGLFHVEETFKITAFPRSAEAADISIAALGNDAGVIGGAWIAKNEWLKHQNC